MQSGKKLLLNAFNMNSVGHISHGMWTHPQDQSPSYSSLEYWVSLAKHSSAASSTGCF